MATFVATEGMVTSVDFSPNGKMLASGGDRIKLWDAETKRKIATKRHSWWSYRVNCVAFSPDGKQLASGGDDQKIKIWDPETLWEIATFAVSLGSAIRTTRGTQSEHSDWINSLAFSQDGNILASGSPDQMIELWNIETRQKIATLTGHSGSVNSLAFSRNNLILASGSDDRTIKIWSIETKQAIATLMGHADSIGSVTISHSGKILASGSLDGTIKLWNLQTKQAIVALTAKEYAKGVNSIGQAWVPTVRF